MKLYIRFASYTRRLLQKRPVLNNCVRNRLGILLIKLFGIPHTRRKGLSMLL